MRETGTGQQVAQLHDIYDDDDDDDDDDDECAYNFREGFCIRICKTLYI
jgi:hypothetical protein